MADNKWAELDLELEQPAPEPEPEALTEETVSKEATPPPEADGIKSQKVNKRIQQLVNQRRERDTRIAELEAKLHEEQVKNVNLTKDSVKTYATNVGTYSTVLQENLDLAQKAYEEAYEKGDAKALAAANQKVISITTQLENLKSHRQQVEQAAVNLEKTPEPKKPETKAASDNDAMEEWLSENEWFQKDPKKTRIAIAYNDLLVAQGKDPTNPGFYEELNSLMNGDVKKTKAPAKEVEEDEVEIDTTPVMEEKPKAAPQMSSSRGKPSATGNKVRLTLQEQDAARKLGISLEEYARQKLRTQKNQSGNNYINIFD